MSWIGGGGPGGYFFARRASSAASVAGSYGHVFMVKHQLGGAVVR